jgi:hypothetical protein
VKEFIENIKWHWQILRDPGAPISRAEFVDRAGFPILSVLLSAIPGAFLWPLLLFTLFELAVVLVLVFKRASDSVGLVGAALAVGGLIPALALGLAALVEQSVWLWVFPALYAPAFLLVLLGKSKEVGGEDAVVPCAADVWKMMSGGLVGVPVLLLIGVFIADGITASLRQAAEVDARNARIQAEREVFKAAFADASQSGTRALVSHIADHYYDSELEDVYVAAFSRISEDFYWIDQATLTALVDQCLIVGAKADCGSIIERLDFKTYVEAIDDRPQSSVLMADPRYERAVEELERREQERAYEELVRNEMNECPYCTRDMAEARVIAKRTVVEEAVRQMNSLKQERCAAGADYYPVGGGMMGKCTE